MAFEHRRPPIDFVELWRQLRERAQGDPGRLRDLVEPDPPGTERGTILPIVREPGTVQGGPETGFHEVEVPGAGRARLGIPKVGQQFIGGVADLMEGVRGGEAERPGEQVTPRGAMAGLSPVAGAAGQAPRGSLGIFGAATKVAPQKIKRAEELAKQGATVSEIHRKTGLSPGADRQWRAEIPDHRVNINIKKMAPGRAHRLSEVMTFPELFRDYPDIAEFRLTREAMGADGPTAYFQPPYEKQPGRITLNADATITPRELRSVMLHELQHAVQWSDNLAKGGTDTAGFVRQLFNQAITEQKVAGNPDIARQLSAKKFKFWQLPPEERQAVIARAYHRQAGEVEARNVQTREGFDSLARREMSPLATEDVPRAHQMALESYGFSFDPPRFAKQLLSLIPD